MPRENAAALWAVVALTGVAAISLVAGPHPERGENPGLSATQTIAEAREANKALFERGRALKDVTTEAVDPPSTVAPSETVRFDSVRVQRLKRNPARDWSDSDVGYVKALLEADLPVAEWNLRAI